MSTKNNNALVNSILYNGDFGTRMVNAEQISAKSLDSWKKSVSALHKALYTVACSAQNYALENADNLDPIFVEFRNIATIIGEVNGFKLRCDINDALAVLPYALKDGNKDAPELQLCLSKLSNSKSTLAKYTKLNGVNPETVAALEKDIATLEEEKDTLLNTAGMRVKVATRTTDNAFRLALEHYLCRRINGQLATTWEELKAQEDALKKARAKKRKANKKSK